MSAKNLSILQPHILGNDRKQAENCVNVANKRVTTLFSVSKLGMLSAEISSTPDGNGRMRKSSI